MGKGSGAATRLALREPAAGGPASPKKKALRPWSVHPHRRVHGAAADGLLAAGRDVHARPAGAHPEPGALLFLAGEPRQGRVPAQAHGRRGLAPDSAARLVQPAAAHHDRPPPRRRGAAPPAARPPPPPRRLADATCRGDRRRAHPPEPALPRARACGTDGLEMRDGHVRKRFDWQPWVYPQCQINYHVGQLSSKAPSSAASSGEPRETGSPSVDGSDPRRRLAEPRSRALRAVGRLRQRSNGRIGTPWRDVACKSPANPLRRTLATSPAAARCWRRLFERRGVERVGEMLPRRARRAARRRRPPPHHSQPTRTFNTTPPPRGSTHSRLGSGPRSRTRALALGARARSSARSPSPRRSRTGRASDLDPPQEGQGKGVECRRPPPPSAPPPPPPPREPLPPGRSPPSPARRSRRRRRAARARAADVPLPRPSAAEAPPLGGAESRSLSDEATSVRTAMATVTEDDWAAIAAGAPAVGRRGGGGGEPRRRRRRARPRARGDGVDPAQAGDRGRPPAGGAMPSTANKGPSSSARSGRVRPGRARRGADRLPPPDQGAVAPRRRPFLTPTAGRSGSSPRRSPSAATTSAASTAGCWRRRRGALAPRAPATGAGLRRARDVGGGGVLLVPAGGPPSPCFPRPPSASRWSRSCSPSLPFAPPPPHLFVAPFPLQLWKFHEAVATLQAVCTPAPTAAAGDHAHAA